MVKVEGMVEVQQPAAFIVEAVGDVARPRAGIPPTAAGLEHLPGKLGVAIGLANGMNLVRHGRAHLLEQVRRLGPIFKYQYFNIPAVMLADAGLLADMLRNEQRAWSAPLAWRVFFEGIDPSAAFMDSPVTLDFEPHKDVRRLLQPAFTGAALASYIEIATPMFEREIDTWCARGEVAFKPAVRRLFARVAGRIFLGVDDETQAAFLDRTLADYWRGPLALVRNRVLSTTWRRAARGYRTLFDWLAAMVPERRKGNGTDLFSRICQGAPDAQWLDDEALVRIFIGVLVGAFDTTSCAVTSMAYELARRPLWQARLRDEPTAIDWMWKETLRLHPVAPDVPRRALRDVELAGHRIPAGAMVLGLVTATLSDPKLWTKPDELDPERFSPARAEDKQAKGAFLPFGAGAHACIGAQLSTLEAKAFWSAMLARCRFELARPYRARHQITPLGMVSGDVALKLARHD